MAVSTFGLKGFTSAAFTCTLIIPGTPSSKPSSMGVKLSKA